MILVPYLQDSTQNGKLPVGAVVLDRPRATGTVAPTDFRLIRVRYNKGGASIRDNKKMNNKPENMQTCLMSTI